MEEEINLFPMYLYIAKAVYCMKYIQPYKVGQEGEKHEVTR